MDQRDIEKIEKIVNDRKGGARSPIRPNIYNR